MTAFKLLKLLYKDLQVENVEEHVVQIVKYFWLIWRLRVKIFMYKKVNK